MFAHFGIDSGPTPLQALLVWTLASVPASLLAGWLLSRLDHGSRSPVRRPHR